MKPAFFRLTFSPKLSFQGKIFIAFCLLTLLSIVSVSGILFVNMRDTIKQNAVTSVTDSIRQADESLNIVLREIRQLNTVVVTNKNIVIDTLLSPNEEISYEWFQEQKIITEFLSGLINYKPYITRIAVVALNGKVFYSGRPWMDRTFLDSEVMKYMLQNGSNHAYFKPPGDADVITVGREIRYNRQTIGVVMIDLDYEYIRTTYGIKPTEDSMLYVLDAQNELIYMTEAETDSDAPSLETVIRLKANFGDKSQAAEQTLDGRHYIVVSRHSENTGWTTLALIPMDTLLSESVKVRNLVIEVSFLVFAVLLIVSLQLSMRSTINIRRLKTMMNHVRDGNLEFPRMDIRSRDEIGELYRVFIGMVDELKRLMEGIRLSEKQKWEAELTALQAQIRPHFLYNSLNTIKYLARLNGVSNIEEVSGSLIELMRGMLGNSGVYLTIREELEYMARYVSIMKYRYMETIRVVTRVEDDRLLDCAVLKLVLQPIVENAIIHGIGPTGRGGVISIRVFADRQDLVIEVEDNGRGMQREQLDELLQGVQKSGASSRFGGMGIRNVHERIVRTYGEPYGLTIESGHGLYTRVTLRVPRLEPGSAVTEGEAG
jgi:two-component system sensor histidine kinase YesM